MIDHFKPMTAIIMISGMAFGPEAGFLVGAVSGFSSNFLFGHGPWTPWQMFAFGTAGFLAGALYRLGWLSKKRLPLSLFGFFAVLLLVGPLLDTWRAVYPDGGDQLGDGQGHLSVWSSDQLHPWGGDLFDPIFLQPPAV